MEKYDITIKFTLNEDEYKRYYDNFDKGINLLLPYGKDYEIYENQYDEEEE